MTNSHESDSLGPTPTGLPWRRWVALGEAQSLGPSRSLKRRSAGARSRARTTTKGHLKPIRPCLAGRLWWAFFTQHRRSHGASLELWHLVVLLVLVVFLICLLVAVAVVVFVAVDYPFAKVKVGDVLRLMLSSSHPFPTPPRTLIRDKHRCIGRRPQVGLGTLVCSHLFELMFNYLLKGVQRPKCVCAEETTLDPFASSLFRPKSSITYLLGSVTVERRICLQPQIQTETSKKEPGIRWHNL